MTPHDTIIVKLPYPVKFLTLKRKIGFTFTNLSIFLFRESNHIETSEQYEQWVKDHGQSGFINEMLFHAACAYCLHRKIKENFTREGLIKAVALSNQATQESILKVWRASETFGATIKESKKKVNLKM